MREKAPEESIFVGWKLGDVMRCDAMIIIII